METSIDGVVIKNLRRIPDMGGWLMEILRCDDPHYSPVLPTPKKCPDAILTNA